MTDQREITTQEAMATLKQNMKTNFEFAWSWHCAIACLLMDVGAKHKEANARATSFMLSTFEVNTGPEVYIDWLQS